MINRVFTINRANRADCGNLTCTHGFEGAMRG